MKWKLEGQVEWFTGGSEIQGQTWLTYQVRDKLVLYKILLQKPKQNKENP